MCFWIMLDYDECLIDTCFRQLVLSAILHLFAHSVQKHQEYLRKFLLKNTLLKKQINAEENQSISHATTKLLNFMPRSLRLIL